MKNKTLRPVPEGKELVKQQQTQHRSGGGLLIMMRCTKGNLHVCECNMPISQGQLLSCTKLDGCLLVIHHK